MLVTSWNDSNDQIIMRHITSILEIFPTIAARRNSRSLMFFSLFMSQQKAVTSPSERPTSRAFHLDLPWPLPSCLLRWKACQHTRLKGIRLISFNFRVGFVVLGEGKSKFLPWMRDLDHCIISVLAEWKDWIFFVHCLFWNEITPLRYTKSFNFLMLTLLQYYIGGEYKENEDGPGESATRTEEQIAGEEILKVRNTFDTLFCL